MEYVDYKEHVELVRNHVKTTVMEIVIQIRKSFQNVGTTHCLWSQNFRNRVIRRTVGIGRA